MEPFLADDRVSDEAILSARIEALAAWIGEVDARVRTAELAGDEATARELRLALEALEAHDPDFERRVSDRVDVLAGRLETLSSALAQAVSSLAATDGELAGLRRSLEDGRTASSSANAVPTRELDEIRRAIAALSSRLDGVAHEPGAAELEGLRETVESAAARVEGVVQGHARRQAELEELTRRFEGSQAQVEDLVASLQKALERSPLSRDGVEEIVRLRAEVQALRMRLTAAESLLDGAGAGRGLDDDLLARVTRLEARIDGRAATATSAAAAGARVVPFRGAER